MRKGYNNYKETKIRTASQTGLIVMLYDEVVRCIDQTIELIEKKPSENRNVNIKNIQKINELINKAQDILGELMSSLDFYHGGDLAKNLFSLYRFFSDKLTEANLTKEVGDLPGVRKLIVSLREAWAVVEANKPDPERGEVNIAG